MAVYRVTAMCGLVISGFMLAGVANGDDPHGQFTGNIKPIIYVSDVAKSAPFYRDVLGFEKIILKNQALKAYFISSKNEEYYKSDTFGFILSYIQKRPNQYRMKETKGKLMLNVSNINSIREAIEILKSLNTNL